MSNVERRLSAWSKDGAEAAVSEMKRQVGHKWPNAVLTKVEYAPLSGDGWDENCERDQAGTVWSVPQSDLDNEPPFEQGAEVDVGAAV